METKTQKKNTYKWNVLRNPTHRSKLLKDVLNFNHFTFITAQFQDNNNNLKRQFNQ